MAQSCVTQSKLRKIIFFIQFKYWRRIDFRYCSHSTEFICEKKIIRSFAKAKMIAEEKE